jgi:long-chain acyl-CoA synthetase
MNTGNISDHYSVINRMVEKVAEIKPNEPAQIYKKDIYNRSMSSELDSNNGSKLFSKISYKKLIKIISALSEGFDTIGANNDTNIGIMAQTRAEWTWCDLALLGNKVTVVPIYKTLKSHNIDYVVSNADVSGIIVEGVEEIQKIQSIEDNINIDFIVSMDNIDIGRFNLDNIDFYTLNDIYMRGVNSDPNLLKYKERVDLLEKDHLATIVHTSGTTGEMKGVKLTHNNISSAIEQLDSVCENANIDLYQGQTNLSFLPLSHIYARMTDQFHQLSRCGTIAYAENVDTLMEDIRSVEPDLLYSVPRLYIRLNKKISESVPDWLLKIGRNTAEKWVENDQKSLGLKIKYKIMDRILYSNIRSKFGSDLDVMVCAGGKVPEDLIKQLRGMSLPIVQGYGMTETAGGISVSSLNSKDFSSVGFPSKDTEVMVDSSEINSDIKNNLRGEVGELMVKGPHITEGYYNTPNDKNTFTSDGYFRTGDILSILDDGRLVYHDRQKLIIVLDTGKNVAPIPIEEKFQEINLVGNCMIIGDDKPFISALIVPDYEYIRNKYNNFSNASNKEISNNKIIQNKISKKIDILNNDLEKYRKVRDFNILDTQWTIENGYLTPSSKLRRKKIKQDFSDEISDIYS